VRVVGACLVLLRPTDQCCKASASRSSPSSWCRWRSRSRRRSSSRPAGAPRGAAPRRVRTPTWPRRWCWDPKVPPPGAPVHSSISSLRCSQRAVDVPRRPEEESLQEDRHHLRHRRADALALARRGHDARRAAQDSSSRTQHVHWRWSQPIVGLLLPNTLILRRPEETRAVWPPADEGAVRDEAEGRRGAQRLLWPGAAAAPGWAQPFFVFFVFTDAEWLQAVARSRAASAGRGAHGRGRAPTATRPWTAKASDRPSTWATAGERGGQASRREPLEGRGARGWRSVRFASTGPRRRSPLFPDVYLLTVVYYMSCLSYIKIVVSLLDSKTILLQEFLWFLPKCTVQFYTYTSVATDPDTYITRTVIYIEKQVLIMKSTNKLTTESNMKTKILPWEEGTDSHLPIPS